MLRKLQAKNKNEGFTIIEVLIVLAIAALILVIVLVAIPQLQRNQRNTARKSVVARVSTELSNASGNNNGAIPISAQNLSDFSNRYLNGINTNDPKTGSAMTLSFVTQAISDGTVPSGSSIASEGTIYYMNGKKCQGEQIVSGTARQFALWTAQEGGAIVCIDNQ